MSAEQVIGCAPFRLQAPRQLTPYEWTVVHNSLLDGFSRAGMFVHPETPAAVAALMGALNAQNQCLSWKMSAFGPAPAVATLPYECLGEWFARLPYQHRVSALGDITYTSMLCDPQMPWNACGTDPKRVGQSWEGAPQVGTLVPGAPIENCAEPRRRTAYIPTTIEQLVAMFKTLGGQVPPLVEQGYSMLPPAARQRTVLLGVQLKAVPDLGAVLTTTNPIVLAQALVEEVAIIWAPGKGSSLTDMLRGNVNPAKLIELATAMMPDVLGGLSIPVIPGLDIGSILGTLGGLFGQAKLVGGMHGGPTPTSGSTGVPVVDTPGDKLDTTAPIPGLKVVDTTFSPFAALAVAAVVAGGVWAAYKFA